MAAAVSCMLPYDAECRCTCLQSSHSLTWIACVSFVWACLLACYVQDITVTIKGRLFYRAEHAMIAHIQQG